MVSSNQKLAKWLMSTVTSLPDSDRLLKIVSDHIPDVPRTQRALLGIQGNPFNLDIKTQGNGELLYLGIQAGLKKFVGLESKNPRKSGYSSKSTASN